VVAVTTYRSRTAAATVMVVLLALLVVPPAAWAQDRPQVVGEQALAMIDYPWQSLGWTIEFKPGPPGYLGLAVGPERRVEIYVRDSHSVTDVAHTLAHEIGHAVDLTYGIEYRRSEYRRLRGLDPDSDWFGCDACSDYATPAGDFAEVFEYWLLGGGDFRSRLAGPPTAAELEILSTLFVAPPEPSVRMFWQQRWQPAP
jgi:hypothetical protein